MLSYEKFFVTSFVPAAVFGALVNAVLVVAGVVQSIDLSFIGIVGATKVVYDLKWG